MPWAATRHVPAPRHCVVIVLGDAQQPLPVGVAPRHHGQLPRGRKGNGDRGLAMGMGRCHGLGTGRGGTSTSTTNNSTTTSTTSSVEDREAIGAQRDARRGSLG